MPVNPAGTLKSFQVWTRKLRTESGKPLRLYQEQFFGLRDYFAGIDLVVEIQPKKNGKTTKVGSLGLHHIDHVDWAEAVILAASRDQADILRRQAAAMV